LEKNLITGLLMCPSEENWNSDGLRGLSKLIPSVHEPDEVQNLDGWIELSARPLHA
jgi:hypothetical protein